MKAGYRGGGDERLGRGRAEVRSCIIWESILNSNPIKQDRQLISFSLVSNMLVICSLFIGVQVRAESRAQMMPMSVPSASFL